MSTTANSDWIVSPVRSTAIPGQFFIEAHRGDVRPNAAGTPTAPERVATRWFRDGQHIEASQELERLIAQHEAGIP